MGFSNHCLNLDHEKNYIQDYSKMTLLKSRIFLNPVASKQNKNILACSFIHTFLHFLFPKSCVSLGCHSKNILAARAECLNLNYFEAYCSDTLIVFFSLIFLVKLLN